MQEDQSSWFRNTPHRWAEDSLPLAYAVACVEVVTRQSETARQIFQKIVKSYGDPALKRLYGAIMAEVPQEMQDELVNALKHPETVLFPDPNKPFREINDLFTGNTLNEILSEDGTEEKILAGFRSLEGFIEFLDFINKVTEFVTVGFNRQSDLEKGNPRVKIGNSLWLMLAIVIKAGFEYGNITIERLRRIYKLRKYKGKVVDFHKVLSEQPSSRLHRMIVAAGKKTGLKLKNDRTILEAAEHWYQSRVVYNGPEEFCRKYYLETGIELYPENVSREIQPVDNALGYPRRKLSG